VVEEQHIQCLLIEEGRSLLLLDGWLEVSTGQNAISAGEFIVFILGVDEGKEKEILNCEVDSLVEIDHS